MATEAIAVLEIFDQCTLKHCENLGPVISREPCSCVLLPGDSICKKLGKIILPGHKITAPLCAACAKIDPKSFYIAQIDIRNVLPSPLKAGFWSAEIVFTFAFSLQLLDTAGVPFKIVCRQSTSHDTDLTTERTWIKAGLSYGFPVTLYGGPEPPVKIFTNACGKLGECSSIRFLVNADALPLKAWLMPCRCWEPYEEPCCCIYAAIGMIGTVQLARSSCRKICGAKLVKPCACDLYSHTPCEYFKKIKFPIDQFRPI